MYPVSDAFKAAVKRSHTMVTLCEVLDHNYQQLHILKVIQGNVSVDGNAEVRRSATIGVVDADGNMTPADANDLLHPLSNNRVRMWRGIRTQQGDEMVSLGVFDIFDADIGDSGENLQVDLLLFDQSKSVSRARLNQNYVVPAGTRYDTAIRNLLNQQVPGLQMNFPVLPWVTPNLVFGSHGNQAGGDPWKYAQEMATAVAHELYFDVQGVLQLKPVPDPKNDPIVWEYREGRDGMVLYINKRLLKEETYNHVYAYGENSQFDNPVQGEAYDDDPNSPTYIYGPYGDVPTFFVSEHIATADQAQQVAEARLRQVLGITEAIHMITTPMPAHEIGDVVFIRRDRAHVNSRYVIDKFNVNLDAWQGMNISLREVRV